MTLRSTLSYVWTNIQYDLFPFLKKEIGELPTKYKDLVSILELVRIEHFLPDTRFNDGRPSKDRSPIARAFIAKIVLKLTYTRQIIDLLKRDEQLRRICGWDSFQKVPSESKFSRAFKEFAESSLPDRVHQALIKDIYRDEVVGHVSKDSTPIEAREKQLKKEKNKGKKKRKHGELNRRQKQLQEPDLHRMIDDLPKQCDVGMKRRANGHALIWKGYKIHAAVDDHCIPLATIVTSASLNDCEAAIPLATKCSKNVTSLYDLMDAAYDHPEIKEHSVSLGHVPIIDKCPSSISQKIEKEAEQRRREQLNFKLAEERRYKERFKTERFNALFKDYYGGKNIVYRGHAKVSCAALFGVLTLTGAMLLNLIQ